VIQWDEENRIKSASDNGSTSDYVYDHTGERVIKRSSQGETAYVNQFYSVRNGSIITKHVFVGTDRIATRVHTSRNNDLYFYHTDHLGSTNVLTDGYGEIYEHLEFFPFGETWVGERATSNSTPYLWSSKELDETGLYNFGKRFMDPRTSIWQSADGAFGGGDYFPSIPSDEREKEQFSKDPLSYWKQNLPGMGGVFNTVNLSVYAYAGMNPVKLTDPDGNELKRGAAFNFDFGLDYLEESIAQYQQGNYGWGSLMLADSVAEASYDIALMVMVTRGLGGGAASNPTVTGTLAGTSRQTTTSVVLSNEARQLSKHPNVAEKLLGRSSMSGNVEQKNRMAEQVINIIKMVGQKGPVRRHARFGEIYDIKLMDGIGARFNAKTNEFIHFLGRMPE
jgi:hypothetical protein